MLRYSLVVLLLVASLPSCSTDSSDGDDTEDSGSIDTNADTNTDADTNTNADTNTTTDTTTVSDSNTNTDSGSGGDSDSGSITDTTTQTDTGSDAEPAWRFVAVGDSRGGDQGVNTAVWSHLVDAILTEDVDFVLFPGDLTTSGTQSSFEHWISVTQPLYDADIEVYVIRGNHDDASLSAWNNTFTGPYLLPQTGPAGEKNLTYSVSHKNAFVAAIDNYESSNKINQSWLEAALAANEEPHVFVFGHEPAFAADHSDTLDDSPNVRNTFWENIKEAGGRTYFCGHDHFYDHARIGDGDGDPSNDLHQFIVGSAGAPLYDFNGNYTGNNGPYSPTQQYFAKQYGYVVIEIDGMNVTVTFMERSGNSYVAKDTFSYSV